MKTKVDYADKTPRPITPGNWRVTNKHVSVTIDGQHPNIQPEFDSIESDEFVAGGGIALVHRKPGWGNANAKLIAASPEMMAALKLAESSLSTYATTGAFTAGQPSGWLLGQLRAAIAKATT